MRRPIYRPYIDPRLLIALPHVFNLGIPRISLFPWPTLHLHRHNDVKPSQKPSADPFLFRNTRLRFSSRRPDFSDANNASSAVWQHYQSRIVESTAAFLVMRHVRRPKKGRFITDQTSMGITCCHELQCHLTVVLDLNMRTSIPQRFCLKWSRMNNHLTISWPPKAITIATSKTSSLLHQLAKPHGCS